MRRALAPAVRGGRAAIVGSWALSTLALVGAAVAASAFVGVHHGRTSAAQYRTGAVLAIAAQQAAVAVGLMATRAKRPLDLVDALALARGGTAANIAGVIAMGAREPRTPAAWLAWLPLIPSATLLDWIDGPLARRRGPTPIGRMLDLESDSWLNLWAAIASARWGGLPPVYALVSLARYGLPIIAARRGGYAGFVAAGQRPLARLPHFAQHVATGVALAPFSGETSRARAQRLSMVLVPFHIVGLIRAYAELLRRTPPGDRAALR